MWDYLFMMFYFNIFNGIPPTLRLSRNGPLLLSSSKRAHCGKSIVLNLSLTLSSILYWVTISVIRWIDYIRCVKDDRINRMHLLQLLLNLSVSGCSGFLFAWPSLFTLSYNWRSVWWSITSMEQQRMYRWYTATQFRFRRSLSATKTTSGRFLCW